MPLPTDEQWRKLCLAGSFLVLLLTGGGSTWLSLLSSGLCLLLAYGCFPLSSRLPWWIGGLHLAGLVAWFLPLPEWMQPAWKDSLREMGAQIPARTAVEASSTLASVGQSWLAWLWMAWIIGQLQTQVSRRAVADGGSRLLAGLAILVLFAESGGFRLPWNQFTNHFSFFANRNQSALLFVVGAIFCLGQFLASYHYGILHRMWGLLATALCLMAAGLYGSRAAFLLSALGMGLLLWQFRRHWQRRQSRTLHTLGLIFFMLLLGFGEIALRRLFPGDPTGPAGFWDEQRGTFYANSFRMWRDHAWLGAGPGHFRFLHPLYAGDSRLESEPLHPESSFWLTWTETGLSGIALSLILIWLFWREFPMRSRLCTEYHSCAGLAAVVVILLHGLIDVSWHRPGIACLFAFAWGMLAEKKPTPLPVVRWWPWAVATLPVLTLALVFFRSPDAEGRDGWARLHQAPLLAGQAVDWRSHYDRGRRSLSQGFLNQAKTSFRLAAHLSGQHPQVTLRIGLAWRPVSPQVAAAVWLEGMRRYANPEEADRYFRRVLSFSLSDGAMAALLPEACRHPLWLATWMEKASLTNWMLLPDRRDITGLPSASTDVWRRLDLLLWRHLPELPYGYFDRLAATWPEMNRHAWRARSRSRWLEGKSEEALALVATHLPDPFPEESVHYRESAQLLRRQYAVNPGDILTAKALLHFYYKNREWVSLLEVTTLMDRFISLHPSWKLLSQFQAAKALQDREQAWTAASKYIQEYEAR